MKPGRHTAAGLAIRPVVLVAWAALAGLPGFQHAWSQPDEVNEPVEVQRARIEARRQQADRDLAEARQGCYRQFAVTDCLRRAQAIHRDIMGDLRRQQVALNDQRRLEISADRERREQARAAEQALRTEPEPRPPRATPAARPEPKPGPDRAADDTRREDQQARREHQARDRAERARDKERQHREREARAAANDPAAKPAPRLPLPVPP